MKCLSLWQPYIAGVLHGDGWCTRKTIGLRCKDRDFSIAFSNALKDSSLTTSGSRQDERGYWLVCVSNRTGKFSHLKRYQPRGRAEIAAWLRGLFDSEGNAQLLKLKKWKNSYHRRVAMFSTVQATLKRAKRYLKRLGIVAKIVSHKNSKGHKGKKKVYQLKLKCSKGNFSLFSTIVGSSIGRKKRALGSIVDTYCRDLSASFRAAQLKGAATKCKTRKTIIIPRVLKEIRQMIDAGIKPTQRGCYAIKGYTSALGFAPHSKLVAMAMNLKDEPCAA